MTGYVYVSPLEKGYLRLNFGRAEHNRLLKNRKMRFGRKVEYYWNPKDNAVISEYYHQWWYKLVLVLVLFIPSIFMQGIPGTIKDLGDLIHERKRGRHQADSFWCPVEKTYVEEYGNKFQDLQFAIIEAAIKNAEKLSKL